MAMSALDSDHCREIRRKCRSLARKCHLNKWCDRCALSMKEG